MDWIWGKSTFIHSDSEPRTSSVAFEPLPAKLTAEETR